MAEFKDPLTMSPTERWTIAITVMFGAFMAVMDTSVVNVSMPHMMGSFGTDLTAITWVATSYSIAEIIMVTMSGWWSALIGRKTLYLASFAIFTIGSILCGTATTFSQMIIYRIIQGIGGGALIPVSQAILRETFPPAQQGMAMALYGMGVVLAPALGPICGGWLTDAWGWPWIFYINIPICIIGMALTFKFVYDPPYLRRGIQSVDWLGIGLLTIFLTGMQIVLERGQEQNWFESTEIIVWTATTLISMLLLIIWELRCKDPVINLRVLKDRNLTLGSIMGLIFGVSLFGTTFILPQFTQEILGYPAFEAGLAMAPRAMALVVFMPIAGWAYQRLGAKTLIFSGILIIIWSYYDLMQLSAQAGFFDLIPPLVIMGIGMPFMFVPLSTVSLSTVNKSDMTDASSVYTLARRVGGNIGYALVAVLVDQGVQRHHAHLSEHISELSQSTQDYMATLSQYFHGLGYSALQIKSLTLGMLDALMKRESTMMAYNDTSFIFGALFLLLIPLIFFLPSKKQMKELIAKQTNES
ncbi:DHA2 family efflux MFS transporter permease subunit [Pseudodesulfovibrio piezophilus]|uniref:Putative Multidrug resistance protein B n=1 Tax=Pseudodesulfovibrio piezophilus (strain DSM 21447 / JCM 15486 / C1TLV30) TaxID=1322246 RepID=M1WN68_PSEP2|nr:DHA2 family efflux MFS transporter permease subunit [Pseudodesulfovibrio piezophilus]CCH50200.1 putative Multidrug resistance protein B [Pseudodesulfovibrio piezophilus C1TLV30]